MTSARAFGLVVAAVSGLASAACSHAHLSAQTMQPNPLAVPPGVEVTRESKHLHIRTKDMEVPRSISVYQTAWFSVVSRDRLRFHVVLVNKWEELTDIGRWNVRLEDDAGRVYYPEAKEKGRKKFTKRSWDSDIHTARTNFWGDVTGYVRDGNVERVPIHNVDLFKGFGDVVFKGPDLFGHGVRRLTLVMERDGVQYRFTWNLFDPRDESDFAYAVVDEGEPGGLAPTDPNNPRGIESVNGWTK